MSVVTGPGLPFWADASTDWQELLLGGARWPGVWTLSGSGVRRDLDMKKAKGSDVATMKDEGYKNAELKATGIIWTAAQWRELQALLPDVHPRSKGGGRNPIQIIHPAANFLGIDSVYLRGISLPEVDFVKGGPLTIELDLIEWTPQPAPVKKGSGGTGGGTGGDTAQTEAERILNEIQNAAANMADRFNTTIQEDLDGFAD